MSSCVRLEFHSAPAGVRDVIILEDKITFFEDESDRDLPVKVVVRTTDDFLDGEKDYERHTITWIETRIPAKGIGHFAGEAGVEKMYFVTLAQFSDRSKFPDVELAPTFDLLVIVKGFRAFLKS